MMSDDEHSHLKSFIDPSCPYHILFSISLRRNDDRGNEVTRDDAYT